MKISRALRLTEHNCTAFVGGGGKTSALFLAAREVAPALVTTSTHLAIQQATQTERHLTWAPNAPMPDIESALGQGITLVTGLPREDIARVAAPTLEQLQKLNELARYHALPLLIEADGSRQKPLKAPAAHEPAIPPFADLVVVTAGLRGLNQPLDENFIHRPELFGALSGLQPGEPVNAEAVMQVLRHPEGGLKNIPPGAQKVILLNQADTPELQAIAGNMARELLKTYAAVIVASVQREETHAVYESIAGIILAAGAASRFGQPKQLLDYHGQPFIRAVAETALAGGLAPVVIVTGAYAEQVAAAVRDLPVMVVHNKNWKEGQSTSVKVGINAIADPFPGPPPFSVNSGKWGRVGGAVFLLADQPQVTQHIIQALVERHAISGATITAPLAADRRANPVLFDRETFTEMLKLSGDTGGRALFTKFPVDYVPWHDESLLFDVDTEDDYRKLLAWGVKD
jgi:molybdenum cofactor cytidylyltransferase